MSFLDYKMNPSKTATHPGGEILLESSVQKKTQKGHALIFLIRNAEINAEMDADSISVHGAEDCDAPN